MPACALETLTAQKATPAPHYRRNGHADSVGVVQLDRVDGLFRTVECLTPTDTELREILVARCPQIDRDDRWLPRHWL